MKGLAEQFRIKNSFLVLVAVATFCNGLLGQMTGVYYEVDTAFYAPTPGDGVNQDGSLAFHVTYNIYATFTNPTDVLGSIYALDDLGNSTEPMYINTPCGCYNHPAGDIIGDQAFNISPLLPDIYYDTFWTIGWETMGESQAFLPGFTYNDANICDAQVTDGSIYYLYTSCETELGSCESGPNGCGGDPDCLAACADEYLNCQNELPNESFAAGDDLEILVARVTSSCGFSFHACFRTFIDGVQEDVPEGYWCMEGDGEGILTVDNVCQEFLDDNADFTVTDDIDCFGELATVEVTTTGGVGPFTYNLIDNVTGDVLGFTEQAGAGSPAVFANLGEGDYVVEVIDGNTCRDTTDLISFIEPTAVQATWNLSTDNLCPGEINNQVGFQVMGGVGDYTHLAEHNATSNTETPAGNNAYIDLPCYGTNGTWTFSVEDENGCTVDTLISLNCPADFDFTSETTDVTCFGYDNGIFGGSLTGGTGDLTLNIELTGGAFADVLVYAGGDFEFSDLQPGDYTFSASDMNGCATGTDFTIVEPAPVSTDHTTTDVLCAGECTGSINFMASGGVGGFTYQTTTMNGVNADANALCAGTYMAFATDANGCVFEDQYQINEPDSIIFDVVVSDVTCAGAANGSICVENASGGTGSLEFQVDPPATGYQTDNCFDLAVGSYTINVRDENLCVVSATGLTLIEPEPIQIVTNIDDITCTGFNDGLVDVSAVGGTGDIFMVAPLSGELPLLVENLEPGDLDITVEDANECQTTLTINIAEPDTLVVQVLATSDPICGGDCNGVALLDVYGGTGGLTLTANNQENVNYNALCAGNYDLLVVDANGCEDTATFEITQPDPVAVVMNVADVTCTGMNDGAVSIVPIGGTGPVVWSIEEEGIDLANLYEGLYHINIQDSIGCDADTTFEVGAEEVTDMILFMLSSPVTCWNEQDGTATVSVTGGYWPISYVWSDNSAQTTPTATGLPEDIYSVVVTDSLGCTLTETVEVEPTIGCLFIADAITPNADGYNDEWIVGGLEYFPNAVVTVFNRYGQEMFRSVGYRQRWDGRFNNNQLPVADYYYVIDFVDGTDPITGTVTLKY